MATVTICSDFVVGTYYIFIYYTSDGHLDCFYFKVVMNNASVKVPEHVLWCLYRHLGGKLLLWDTYFGGWVHS